MKTDKKPTYTTRGDVCHGCDHAHRTIAAARQCIDRQQARIARGNPGSRAYTDARVVRNDGRPLSEAERSELADYLYARVP